MGAVTVEGRISIRPWAARPCAARTPGTGHVQVVRVTSSPGGGGGGGDLRKKSERVDSHLGGDSQRPAQPNLCQLFVSLLEVDLRQIQHAGCPHAVSGTGVGIQAGVQQLEGAR